MWISYAEPGCSGKAFLAALISLTKLNFYIKNLGQFSISHYNAFSIEQGRQVSKFKGQKRLPGYQILFLQEQAKEFYFCTKLITSGLIRSKCCSAQIIHLTCIQFLCFGQWPWLKSRCQIEIILNTMKKCTCCFHFGILFPQNDPCSFLKKHTDWQHNHEGWWWPQDCPSAFGLSDTE